MSRQEERGLGPKLGTLALGVVLSIGFAAQALADCGYKAGDPKAGDAVYHETCVACHGEDGKGAVPGAPDFTKKGGPLSKPHKVLTQHIENGFQESGVPLSMPPKGGNPALNEQQIKDVHAYLHKAFGCGS